MDGDVHQEAKSRLTSYRNWSRNLTATKCRLVQYCGVDVVGTFDVPLDAVEPQIRGRICEGFQVDWTIKDECIYLRVWEFGGPEPDWSLVFEERPLADIEAILREAKKHA